MARVEYETVIGLEIHLQLRTTTKLFCGCAPEFGDPPNVHTCPVCLGLPGALPVLNRKAVRRAVRAATALGCRINERSRFARKNYFYPDLPKGYQISQYDQPLAEEGSFEFEHEGRRRIRIVRLHLEEDAGKSIHGQDAGADDASYVDLNRCGVPLVEVVTAPDLRSPEEAVAFLTLLRATVRSLGVTDASLEQGSMRCDANISVRPTGQGALNPKSELKNLNSFRFMRRALRYEDERQTTVLERGGRLHQTTRMWDERAGVTASMRGKEEAHDYRYFPEPDLVPVVVSAAERATAASDLPELPLARADRWVASFGLTARDAFVLTEEEDRADYFEAVIAAGAAPRSASNWVRGPVLHVVHERQGGFGALPVEPAGLAALIGKIDDETLSEKLAKQVFERMVETGASAADVIEAKGLEQITDPSRLASIVEEVLAARSGEVDAYRAGRQQVFGFLMGEVMRASGGRASPQLAQRLLRERLET